jgi:hypothetical protein
MLNVRKLLEAGYEALAKAHAEKEKKVKGHPRVGSIGCVANGEVYGVCHRIAHARQLGLEVPPEQHTEIMWKAGEAVEHTWQRLLEASGFKGTVLSQDEVNHKIEGVPLAVLGHPDLKLLEDESGEQLGIELKGIFGSSTAVQVFFECRPKNENLIQSAAYAYFLGIPYELWYTSSSWISLAPWDKKTYGVSNIKPFHRGFKLEWRDDVLFYKDETQEEWVETCVSVEGILEYYRLVEEMKTGDLGPRVNATYINGKPNKWGEQANCGLCEFKASCDQYDGDKDYQAWLDSIRLLTR